MAHITSGLRYYVPILQVTVISLLTVSISVIFYYLSKTESMTEDISAFRLEKRILITILLIFDSSYVLRLIYDIILAHQTNQIFHYIQYDYWQIICMVVMPNVFDLIPISCILYIHARNFQVIKNGNLSGDIDSETEHS